MRQFASHPRVALGLALGVGLAFRLYGVNFGLPALYDRDEPLFILTALKMLRSGEINPGWFGHPGTTTLYALALVDLLVFAAGRATGYFVNAAGLAKAIFSDPSVVVLPGRLFIVACGMTCIALTARLGTHLFNERTGLMAACFLAVMPLHITYSQIIRTDMQAATFILMACLGAIAIIRRGRPRDYILAALAVGAATATKWPAAAVGLCPVAACFAVPGVRPERALRNAIFVGLGSIGALIAISPYLLLDYKTVLTNLGGESRPFHLGATGGGFWWNLGWYLRDPLPTTLGVTGLVAALGGFGLAARASAEARVTMILATLGFMILLCNQHLIWARWLVPILPFAAISVAVALGAIADRFAPPERRTFALVLLGVLVALPMVLGATRDAVERTHDTRGLASEWVLHHVPLGTRIVLEYPAFDLLARGHTLYYPLGDVGCVDGSALLRTRGVSYEGAAAHQGRSPSINIGSVASHLITTCLGDIVILSEYDRYRLEAAQYPLEHANYRAVLAAGHPIAQFFPARGRVGGPIVRIIRIDRR